MNSLAQIILDNIKNKKSVFLVGSTDSGKTWFAKKKLMPFLEKQGYSVIYFKDCDYIDKSTDASVVIIDEVETLLDLDYLEKKNPNKLPYYSEKYLMRIKNWHKKLKKIKQLCIYIVTRNSIDEIANFKKIHKTDWDNRKIAVVSFERGSR